MSDENSQPGMMGFTWQQSRRRDPFPEGAFPVRGFGTEGQYTLWLVSPVEKSRVEFVEGRATRVVAKGKLPQKIVALARVVLDSFNRQRMTVDLRFMDYAAAVIRHSYATTDDELQMLLTTGTAWHEEIILHMLGAERIPAALAVPGIFAPGPAPERPALIVASPAPARTKWIHRLTALLRNRHGRN